MKSQFERITELVYKKYGNKPEFPWREFPGYAVFRHPENRKWYALIMNIPPERLYAKVPAEGQRLPEALKRNKEIHILDLKMPRDEIPGLVNEPGIFPAYHMNAMHWISTVLEDILSDEAIMGFVEKSFRLTEKGVPQ